MSISLEKISYTYNPLEPNGAYALKNLNLEIKQGEFIGLLGHTGSGKSTLVQLMAGLIQSTEGRLFVDGIDFSSKSKERRQKKLEVGLVFQYPEYQLFEETVARDIAFGPKNLGLSEEEITKRVKEAMVLVDLDYETYKDVSPFSLSGGQKRRVAIAGVLAMRPSYLILDEPTAGLDPKGRNAILSKIKALHETLGMAIILVSHSMDDVAKFASRLLVMNKGELVLEGTPQVIFEQKDFLESIGLGVPSVTQLMYQLREKGLAVSPSALTLEEAYQEIIRALMERGGGLC